MPDPIKTAFVQGDSLHFVCNGEVLSVKAQDGKEPNEWTMIHFANVGTSEAFVEAFSGELLELVDASSIHGAERAALKTAIMTVLVEGLMPAFEHLKKIRISIASPLPELNRRQIYEDFARGLWHAYKDLFPKAVLLTGFEIGFLFKKEADFEKELAKFMAKVPSLILDLPEFVRRQRTNWQQGLAGFRNDYLEHRKVEFADVASYYQPRTAEMLFEHVWRTMYELFPPFLEARFAPMLSIMEIPQRERDQARLRRWQCFQCEPVERGTFPK